MARKYEEVKAKPANDAYTGMLAVSLLALLAGCFFLFLDYSRYSDKPKPVVYDYRARPPAEAGAEQKGKEGDKQKEGEDKDKKDKEGEAKL
jgi:hypothetical protein